jgi:hypothetical protein
LALRLAVSPSSVRQRTDTHAPGDDARKTTKALRDPAQAVLDYHAPHGFLTRARNQSVPALSAARLLAADPGIMTPSTSSSRLGSEFDDFLFAPLGEDRNGLPLSIVSLLGRMGLDPWQEAASLTGLPIDAAVQRLASLLAALPVRSLTQADPAAMAARLIGLLPPRADPTALSSVPLVNVSAATLPRVVMTAILLVIYLILFFGSPFVTSLRDPPAHTDATHTPASLTAPSHTPPGTE